MSQKDDSPAAAPGEVHYRWSRQRVADKNGERAYEPRVTWSLKASNGHVLVHSQQGSRDITDAREGVRAVARALGSTDVRSLKEVGPGQKPKA